MPMDLAAISMRNRSATTLKRIGVAFLVVGITTNFLFIFGGGLLWVHNYKLLDVILSVLALILLSFGAFLYWRGRQYAAEASAKGIITDTQPHLLYLRPFRSDETTKEVLFHAYSSFLFKSEEEQLADVLQPFGELLAIGRPGESLPTPGAARIYTSDEKWKDVVKRQIQISRLVVIRAAVGENVLWELTQAVRTLEPQKLLILVLKMKAEDYKYFCSKATPILGVSLPERATRWPFGRVSGFINFAAGGKPSFLALKVSSFRGDSFNRPAKYALRPVFENFGLKWQPPSMLVPFMTVGVPVVAGVVAFAILLIFF